MSSILSTSYWVAFVRHGRCKAARERSKSHSGKVFIYLHFIAHKYTHLDNNVLGKFVYKGELNTKYLALVRL